MKINEQHQKISEKLHENRIKSSINLLVPFTWLFHRFWSQFFSALLAFNGAGGAKSNQRCFSRADGT